MTEHDAIAAILTNCNSPGSAPAPANPPTTTGAGTEPVGTPPVSIQPTIPVDAPESGSSAAAPPTEVAAAGYYPNCKAAKAAGAAPLYVGQPGYRPGLDRDHDGIACES